MLLLSGEVSPHESGCLENIDTSFEDNHGTGAKVNWSDHLRNLGEHKKCGIYEVAHPCSKAKAVVWVI